MIGRLVAVLLIALAACGSGDEADTLPEVELEHLTDGESILMSDIDGPAVVNLWATWCAPCRREIPDFEAVHRARGDEVTFVGVNIGQEADTAAEFLDEVGATYDQYLDPEGFAQTELRTTTMPTTVVIDADGVIVARHLGPMDQGDLNDAIDAALS